MASKNLIFERDGALATITLNRPEVRNALDREMIAEFHAALDEALAADVRAIVVTGAGGKAFAAGADIREMRERSMLDAFAAINSGLFKRVEDLSIPTIAAISGFALGGGCELAMSCDLRVAGASAKLGQPEVGLGIMAAAGATYRLPRLVGLGRAKELLFTGRIVDAAEAERIGLVNRVVPDERVVEEAKAIARTILEKAPLAIRVTKLALNTQAAAASGHSIDLLGQALLFETADKREGMTAFLEKRKADFHGR
ncbi:MAG: enoyl-CoA hydratase/isomerase family protein [Planctomycetes bacterium]|nr:enoyl-CoA hydratase/isomerase family protein [Planctomycetota bacterium]MBI3847915.1 enoyl-CoA hydratase/isomerase family protein [Planctomycetota bacterium]